MSDLEQFKITYITECFELLGDMEERLMALNCDESDIEQLNAIFRCAHSIKGGSGAFGLTYITNFTHVLEALLDVMREGKIQATKEVVDTLLTATDIVNQMVRAAQEGTTPPDDLGDDILQKLQNHAGGAIETPQVKTLQNTESSNVSRKWDINFAPKENMFATGNEPLLLLRELEQLGNVEVTPYSNRVPAIADIDATCCYIGWGIQLSTEKSEADIKEVFEFVEDHCDLTITENTTPNTDAKSTQTEKPAQVKIAPAAEDAPRPTSVATSIRVDLEKVDRLVNMVGELVITEAMLCAQTRQLPVEEFTTLLRGIDELSQHTRELQEAVMSVRMQPVKSVFSRMPRIVRDLSSQLSKDIKLEMAGENTEVDKTVIEQLSDPLTHMIRNSIDHGIETPEIRTQAGKPGQGTILLSADHRGGRIVIEIRDDGAGINRQRVLAKAKEKGLLPEDAVLSDEECDNLIFMPGFSTAEVVSNVSGRGVGMDVVKRNIEGLSGVVKVRSEEGKGSVFTVSLPLTLAILDGMIVRVGCENYIIPITSIIETMRPAEDVVRHVEGTGDVINVRGEFIPLVYLHSVFSINGAEKNASKALVVLVESGTHKMGLVVDELIGQQQVVIKSLATNADPVKGVSGATILGDGRVSLILEISELQQSEHTGARSQNEPQAA